jgi:hypothetical protein
MGAYSRLLVYFVAVSLLSILGARIVVRAGIVVVTTSNPVYSLKVFLGNSCSLYELLVRL